MNELAVVRRLLPVVAENAYTRELAHRDLGLAGPVGAHEARVLAGLQRVFLENELAPRRHRDQQVGGKGCFAAVRDVGADASRYGLGATAVDIPHEHLSAA